MSDQKPCCGPDCGCNTQPPKSKWKTFFFVLVVLAVAGILTYKLAFQSQATPVTESPGFNTGLAATQTRTGANTTAAVEMLATMNALNEKAMNQDAVMVWVPGKDGSAMPPATLSALQSAQQTLQGKAVKLALYQLQNESADQNAMSRQLTLPAVLVLSKGRGMGTVTGEITQDKLMQAYVASSRTGGCCPGGAASSSCPPAK